MFKVVPETKLTPRKERGDLLVTGTILRVLLPIFLRLSSFLFKLTRANGVGPTRPEPELQATTAPGPLLSLLPDHQPKKESSMAKSSTTVIRIASLAFLVTVYYAWSGQSPSRETKTLLPKDERS